MRQRWPDWLIASLLALLLGMILTRPFGPRPEDLALDVTVGPGPAPDQAELTVRWRWLKPPRPLWTDPSAGIGLVYDPARLVVTDPSSWSGFEADATLLPLGEPLPSRSQFIRHGEDGEIRFVFRRRPGLKGDRWPDPVRVQYIHREHGAGALPGQGWVKSVPITLPIGE
ncbi:MAG: hypothetical protein ACOY94_16725 [Bacillota bacterium]